VTRLKQHFLEDNNDIQIQEIKAAMKNNRDKNMHTKYLVIYNHLKGCKNIQIAQMIGLCQHTVGTYIRKYKA
jgi:DNA-binding NarL/FixJ family response regulator